MRVRPRGSVVSRLCALGLVAAALGAATRASADSPPPAPSATAPFASFAWTPGETEPPAALLEELAVDVRDDVSDQDIAELGRSAGVDLQPASALSATDKLEIGHLLGATGSAVAVRDALARLVKDPRVEAAEPMSVLRASFVPNDPLYRDKQWHLPRIGTERAWEYGCGRGVTVAVVDTGIACFDAAPFSRGSDLGGTRCLEGFDFVNNRIGGSDDQGHGTFVAGTIAQTTNNGLGVAGIAHCSALLPVKVLNKGGWGTVTAVSQGIRWAADHGAQVINLSLGGEIKSAILESAVRHAHAKGAVIVAAAGNSGRDVNYPAAYPDVIAVSATDANDRIAWFSSRGPELALAAPGVEVTQQTICKNGLEKCELFGTFSGTSMSAPHVAGAAALLVGLGVSEPVAVRDALTASARRPPKADPAASAEAPATLYGAGLLDAGAAVFRAHWMHVLWRLFALIAVYVSVGQRIRLKGGTVSRAPAFRFGLLVTSIGLLPFAPLLHLEGLAGPLRVLVETLSRPLGEWDLALGAGMHRFLPLANALPALALAGLVSGTRTGRWFAGGVALGSAAFLLALGINADVSFPLGTLALRVWAFGNAAVCLWLARINGDAKRF